jgi:putative DNA primase/helicase
MNGAVVGITHFAKSMTGRNPAERVIGSQAFAAFVRMVLVAAKDEDTDNRVFTRAKSNISIDDGGFNYTIQEVTLPSGIKTTRILWGIAIDGSARNILVTVEKGDNIRFIFAHRCGYWIFTRYFMIIQAANSVSC